MRRPTIPLRIVTDWRRITVPLVALLLASILLFPPPAAAIVDDAALVPAFESAANAIAHEMPVNWIRHDTDPATWASVYGMPEPLSAHDAKIGWSYDLQAFVYPDAAGAQAAFEAMARHLEAEAAAAENSAPGVSWVFYRHHTVQRTSFHGLPSVLWQWTHKEAFEADGSPAIIPLSREEIAVLYPEHELHLNGYHLEEVHEYTRAWVEDNLLVYVELPRVGDDEVVFGTLSDLGPAPKLRGSVRDAESAAMKGLELRLVAEKDGASTSLGTTNTDADGDYELSLSTPPAGAAVKLVVTLRHEWAFSVHSGDPGATVVIASVPVPASFFGDGQDHDLDVVFGQSPLTSLQGLNTTRLNEASVVYRNTETALSHVVDVLLEPKSSFTRGPLPVFVHASGNTAFYQPGPAGSNHIVIDLADSGVNSGNRPMNREWHEFAHYLMDELYPGGMPSTPGSNHGGTANPDSGDSVVEGFAEFYSLMVADMPHYFWAGSKSNLDDNGITNGRTDEEFAIAGLYWDLYDGIAAADGDYIDLDRYTLWGHITAGETSVHALYDRLKNAKVGAGDTLKTDSIASDLDLLFIEHGFYQDANKNGRHDGGEPAGWAGAVSGTQREDKKPRPGGSVRLNLTDAGGSPLSTATVVLDYHSPQGGGLYDFTQEVEVGNGGLIHFDLPDVSGASMTFRIKGAPAGAPEVTVQGDAYWAHVRQSAASGTSNPITTGTLGTGASGGGGGGGGGGGASSFWDVPTSHPYHDAIVGMADAGVINGFTDGSFGPGKLVTRQQFAKMIVGTLGFPCSEADVCPFWDVSDGGPTTLYPDNYVAVAADWGITNGIGNGQFGPYRSITRAQVITMVVRAAQQFTAGLQPPDAAYSGWGIFSGFSDPTHGYNAQLAEFNGLLNGIQGSGDPVVWAWRPATRGEVAQILWNLSNAGVAG